MVAKISADTAENEPSKVSPKGGVPSGSFRGHIERFARSQRADLAGLGMRVEAQGRGYGGGCGLAGQRKRVDAGSLQLENDSVNGDKNYFINEEYNIQTQSTYADNLDLDAAAGFNTADTSDDILDFTERNPFGEVDN